MIDDKIPGSVIKIIDDKGNISQTLVKKIFNLNNIRVPSGWLISIRQYRINRDLENLIFDEGEDSCTDEGTIELVINTQTLIDHYENIQSYIISQ